MSGSAFAGPVVDRDRGASAGELLVCPAQSQLLVAMHWSRWTGNATMWPPPSCRRCQRSRRRRRVARPAGSAPSKLAGVATGNAEVIARAVALLPVARGAKLETTLTVDMDSTDVEVYGPANKGWPTTTPVNVLVVRT